MIGEGLNPSPIKSAHLNNKKSLLFDLLPSFQPAPCFGPEFSGSKTKGMERQTEDTQISPVFFGYFSSLRNVVRETIKQLRKPLKKCQNLARLRRTLCGLVFNDNNLVPRRRGSPAGGGICLRHDQPRKNDFFRVLISKA
jgi:hypothetical protein